MRSQTKRLGDVIPAPALVVPEPAVTFTITPVTTVSAPPAAAAVAAHLGPLADDGPIRLELTDTDGLGAEGYRLAITATGVSLRAAEPAGLFWGVQTLRQLAADDGVLPGGVIEDRPRFAYRGAMLDLARHFFTADEIRAHLDLLVQFKINHLHLHLTDDQGWRLEIPGWPRLTEVGGGPGTGCDGTGPGFLTLAEYADVVAYAAERFVTVIPEIDMPGHVNAALVAYPELTADGRPVAPRTDAEVGYSSLVAGKDETYAFVETVLKTVADVTPGPFLHIGGDECLSTSAEDYHAFLSRALPLAGKYGKRAIGWHEIAATDLPEGTVVQYWRPEPEDAQVLAAVAAGHQVIMSPADRTYLDMKYAADTPLGLDWAGLVPVRRSYEWDPATRLAGVGEQALLGVAAPLWSETLRTVADVQYLTFPRLPAVAEVGWTPQAGRDWAAFRERLAAFGPRWDAAGVNYHRSPEIDWPSA
ncbi:beta-N-acetylhexosaminidase [Actinoplanes sp. SE50]|uniref:beta-N-acetylhexosaminidase n=1 Tax=unclassified Actinoplanes TaxID=2626549 RepID=UPI00023ECFCC|nr:MULTISPECIES: family 20 glycosylhydrolase [unclassified Actinoplanes]AEV82140.1 beta-hexosaminidase [Actinoplanes sp. SE50/110]ATO80539.1 beta-N-acetylhexosaminidase [Actinoplanes sp. SE50]SLL97945.1 beta-N-acetylhexosaminidase [Actinoplanes sp. SE50/110]